VLPVTSASSVVDVVEPVVLPVVRAAVAVPTVLSPLRPALLGAGTAPATGVADAPSAPGGGLLLWALWALLAGLATWPRARRFVLMLSA
jgi:hypothetical protein